MRILHSKKLVYVSKPRCGSTSIRRILDKHMVDGDISCDWAGQFEDLHPHMSGPAIWHYLDNKGLDADKYSFFTVTRNPLDMLWSCYKYFEPDVNNRYNFDKGHTLQAMSFDDWVMHGRLGLGVTWRDYVPPIITENNLTPLALETFILDQNSHQLVNHIFKMEERTKTIEWLSSVLGKKIKDVKVNMSKEISMPPVSDRLMDRIKVMFPLETEMYFNS